MENLQSSLILVFAFLIFLRIITKNKKNSSPRLPPGPRKLPFIGNLHQLVSSLPHISLKNLAKKHGPVMHLQLGEVSTLVISSPEAAKEVMKIQDIVFSDRPMILLVQVLFYNGTNIGFAPYGEYWRQLRKICTLELLSLKRVKSFRSVREEEVANLVKSISSSMQAPINLSKLILTFTHSMTCRTAFSHKTDDADGFISAVREFQNLGSGFEVPDLFPSYKLLHRISKAKPALEKLHVRIDKILTKIIDVHSRKKEKKLISTEGPGHEDLVDVLLRIQESSDLEFPITTNNIKAIILDIFSAGVETSSTTMEWAISELIKNPQIMEKVQAEIRNILKGKSKIDETDIQEMNYLKQVIKETLRLHPPLPLLLPRESREICKINGYDIPIKTKVIVNVWAMGRDPEHWVNPERFDPDRFNGSPIDFKGANFEYIPFGAGRRMCPGISFGVANIELPLAQLLYHFDWKLPNGTKPEEIDMSEEFGVALTRKNDLVLIGVPYAP